MDGGGIHVYFMGSSENKLSEPRRKSEVAFQAAHVSLFACVPITSVGGRYEICPVFDVT